jgi:hypothetical protein
MKNWCRGEDSNLRPTHDEWVDRTLPLKEKTGAAERIRTSDPRITNALLYRLSYRGAPQTPRATIDPT